VKRIHATCCRFFDFALYPENRGSLSGDMLQASYFPDPASSPGSDDPEHPAPQLLLERLWASFGGEQQGLPKVMPASEANTRISARS
jgi:hypothetical protein